MEPTEKNGSPQGTPQTPGKKRVYIAGASPSRRKKPQRRTAPKPAAPKRPLWESCYRLCYYVGIQTMRTGKRLRRRLLQLVGRLKHLRLQRHSHRSYRRQKFLGGIRHRLLVPFREASVRYRAALTQYQEAKGRRPDVLARLWMRLASWKPAAALIANHVFPAIALVVLLSSIHYFSTMDLALAVEYEGQDLGSISSESVFAEAQAGMKQLVATETSITKKNIVPTYTLTVANEEELTDAETLTNRLITASGGKLEEAAGFYLADRFIGAVENGDKLLDYLVNVLAREETGAENESISFVKKMQLKEGLYPSSSVIPLHKLVERLAQYEQVEEVYVIEQGDTPTGVASKNNMPYSELKALNPEIETAAFFQIGNEVLISKAESYLATKVTRTEVYEEDIPFGVDSIPDDRYPQGYQVVVSAGINGKQQVTANVTYIDGIEQSRTILKIITLSEPVNKVVRSGTMVPASYIEGLDQSGTGFIWPVDWGYFNGSLGSYWGHTGMDIAGNYRAPIRAARSGTVVRSAWYGPYGMHVIIDHGNGVTTLYAHMSEKYVSVGQYVVQGQMIGLVGRTGNVTGPHLHFEVRINGIYQDPIKYIGTYKR